MRILSTIVIAGLLTASPAMAQKPAETPAAKSDKDAKAREPEKPVTESDVSAADVATTPLSDLNLRKGEIPALLLAAQDRPYDMAGLTRCSQLSGAVNNLDAILGEDIDITDPEGGTSAGKVAQSAVGALIPFRGLIREVSGANSQDRKLQLAIRAGMARRAFLKGVGMQRGCPYPARPASAQIVASKLAAISAADPKDKDKAQAATVAAQEAKPKAKAIRKKTSRTRRR
ncbi:hypothetical protein [Novosphingobium sp.]|uniref:hypothetical protein n=1 Tax=Novosphingobium sp. TaxID=1874826 RepID=UPI00286E254D|nr:hypothetical protein [Novosphingobium sp.]